MSIACKRSDVALEEYQLVVKGLHANAVFDTSSYARKTKRSTLNGSMYMYVLHKTNTSQLEGEHSKIHVGTIGDQYRARGVSSVFEGLHVNVAIEGIALRKITKWIDVDCRNVQSITKRTLSNHQVHMQNSFAYLDCLKVARCCPPRLSPRVCRHSCECSNHKW